MRKKAKKQITETEEVSVQEEKKKKPAASNSVVTKESFCAVFALFSILSFFILITDSAVFGVPGAYMHALLMGLFGYLSYPIVALTAYNCIMGFLGVRLLRKHKTMIGLIVSCFLAALVVHTVQTYFVWGYTNENYLVSCFNSGDAFPKTSVAGWLGGLAVYGLTTLTTKIGALVILSALCVLAFYITAKPMMKKIAARAKEPKQPKQPKAPKEGRFFKRRKASVETSEAPTSQVQSKWIQANTTPSGAAYGEAAYSGSGAAYGEGVYNGSAYGEGANAPMAQGNEPAKGWGDSYSSAQQTTVNTEKEVPPMDGYSENGVSAQNMGGYAPFVPYTVRRPGFTMSGDNASSEAEQQPMGQAPTSQNAPMPSVNDGGYSPFGAAAPKQQPGRPITPEESRRILFGSTPAQNYQDNLIFDGNANVNRRGASYNPSAAPTYSEQYNQSMQNPASPRPRKVVGDSGENFGRRATNDPYSLNGGRGEASRQDAYRGQNYQQPTYPQPGYQQSNQTAGRAPAAFDYTEGRNADAGNGRGAYPRGDENPSPRNFDRSLNSFGDVASDRRASSFEDAAFDRRVSSSFGTSDRGNATDERSFGRRGDESTAENTAQSSADSGRRHQYMDTFSLQNPNIFGQSGNRARGAEEEAATDRSSIFEEEPPMATPTPRSVANDPYSLRTYDAEPKTPVRGSDVETGTSVRSRDVEAQTPMQERRVIPQTPVVEPESIVVEPKVEKPVAPFESERFGRMQTQSDAGNSLPTAASRVSEPAPVEEKPAPPPKPRIHKPYVRVPLHYFNCSDNAPDADAAEVENIKTRIIETLQDYNVSGGSIASVTFGPTVTRYNVVLPRGVSPKKVVSLEQEIAMGLCREGVNVYPNVEDGAVSIEVPNRKRQTVELGCMFIDDAYTKAKPTSLVFAMGKDIANRKVYGDVCKMTHLLVAGSSGSGKSVFLGCLIISLITKYSPDEMRLILIDPKKTEFVLYNGLPHLMVNEIITDCKKAVQSLSWAIGEMERRYSLIEKKSLSGTYVVNIDEYNANLEPGEEKLPKIVIIVDELADLMLNAKKDMEDKIQSLTQKARAAGIHLILATQRPSTDVITGVIKSNLPTRIAFTVATDVDSRVILDQTGAQKLLGKGDMVYTASGINTPVRVQSPFISSTDSQKVVNFIKENNEAYFDESATTFINNTRSASGGEGGDVAGGDVEPVYLDALKLVIQTQTASISMLQRKCSIGFNKAGKIIEWMEMMEYISPYEGAKARRVLITREKFIELYGEW